MHNASSKSGAEALNHLVLVGAEMHGMGKCDVISCGKRSQPCNNATVALLAFVLLARRKNHAREHEAVVRACPNRLVRASNVMALRKSHEWDLDRATASKVSLDSDQRIS